MGFFDLEKLIDIYPDFWHNCPMSIQNLPQQRSDHLAQLINNLRQPKPLNIQIVGDVGRYQKERSLFELNRSYLLQLKSESDELAALVDESLYPEKRTLKAKKFQKLRANAVKLQALKTILKNRHI